MYENFEEPLQEIFILIIQVQKVSTRRVDILGLRELKIPAHAFR